MKLSFGKNVAGARKRRRMTLKDLGRISGVSPSTISRLEQGKTIPSLIAAIRIAQAPRISIDELVKEI
jgi:transcriptional regulator with XRE-family HTH domain